MNRRDVLSAAAGLSGLVLFGRGYAGPCAPGLAAVPDIPPPSSCPNLTEAPSWVGTAVDGGWAVGDWIAISGPTPSPGYGLTVTNTMIDVADWSGGGAFGNAFIHAWNGGVLAQGFRSHGMYILGPGGAHNEYGRGDMYGFDIEARTWEQLAPPNTSGDDPSSAFGEYNDGAPINNHSASWLFYDSHRNEMAMPRGYGDPTSGSTSFPKPYGHGFSLANYDQSGYSVTHWRRYPELSLTSTELNDRLAPQCGGVWDESRKSYWLISDNDSSAYNALVAKYDSVTNSWTKYPTGAVFTQSGYAIDPIRDVLVTTAGWRCLDLANPDVRKGAPGSSDRLWRANSSGSVPTNVGQPGFEWSTAHNGFLLYDWNNNTVYLGRYNGGGTFAEGTETDYSLIWSVFDTGSNGVSVPGQQTAGSFNKFRVARWGDVEIAFFAPRANGAIYALRVI